MEVVLISLTSVINFIVAVIHLIVTVKKYRKKEKDFRSTKRKP